MNNNQMIGRQKFNPNQTMKSFPLLAIEQFERAILAHNVEFRRGYNIKRASVNGEVIEEYVPNTRDVFCNTCKALALIIYPSFTTHMKSKYEELMKELEELEAEFLKNTSIQEDVVLGEIYYKTREDKILFESYQQLKVKIHQELFRELCTEIHKKKFWQSATTDD
jgi:hypothetical protein